MSALPICVPDSISALTPERYAPHAHPFWRTLQRPAALPPHLRRWLSDEGSLTRHLQQASQGEFQVRLLRQAWQCPRADEAAALALPSRQRALIREVLLCGRNEPWVFARTVIPATTLHGRHRRLRQLGNRSLGSVLFRDPGMCRRPLQIACLPCGSGERLWSRRSIFTLDRRPLLVCEIFLPAIEQVPFPR